ncbi:MAG TPA: hypothetical protein VKZ50_03920 [bacterium]|nr:hypothetical protein [bacterium]
MTRDGQGRADQIRAELARQGIAADEDDLAVIVKIVAANRAGLERARAAVRGDPEVPHGFVPPAPPGDAAPHAGR